MTFSSVMSFSSSRTPGLAPVPFLEVAEMTVDSSGTPGIAPVLLLEVAEMIVDSSGYQYQILYLSLKYLVFSYRTSCFISMLAYCLQLPV
uniref:Uncharacterized protein n=1 Tax=Tanacetum cinerariifolium TaxID=118510 RepID=A0A699TIN2_TANCI|nr:hypothetical protein [Tanacetum cinerariifolium]